MTVTAYIGFGSNQGDLEKNLKDALNRLNLNDEITVLRVSRLYHTEPLTKDDKEQPWYLNTVIEITTSLSLHKLLYTLKDIEKGMGRKSTAKWKPRIVDLDILFYAKVIYKDDELRVPHRDILERNFVMKPLCDLIPDFEHPEYNMTIREILSCSKDKLKVEPLETT